jgi:hypothetical protein
MRWIGKMSTVCVSRRRAQMLNGVGKQGEQAGMHVDRKTPHLRTVT